MFPEPIDDINPDGAFELIIDPLGRNVDSFGVGYEKERRREGEEERRREGLT